MLVAVGPAAAETVDPAIPFVVHTVSLDGDQSTGSALDSLTGTLYVSGANVVSAIDGDSGEVVASIPLIEATSIAIDPTLRRAYVAVSSDSGALAVIDLSTNTIVEQVAMPSGTYPSVVLTDVSRGITYVATSTTLVEIDSETLAVIRSTPGTYYPAFGAISESSGTVYLNTYGSSALTVYDTSTHTFASSVDAGGYPSQLAVDESAGVLWASRDDGNLARISIETGAVLDVTHVGQYAGGVTVDPDGSDVYAITYTDDFVPVRLAVVNTDAGSVRGDVGLESLVGRQVVFDAEQRRIFVTDLSEIYGGVTILEFPKVVSDVTPPPASSLPATGLQSPAPVAALAVLLLAIGMVIRHRVVARRANS